MTSTADPKTDALNAATKEWFQKNQNQEPAPLTDKELQEKLSGIVASTPQLGSWKLWSEKDSPPTLPSMDKSLAKNRVFYTEESNQEGGLMIRASIYFPSNLNLQMYNLVGEMESLLQSMAAPCLNEADKPVGATGMALKLQYKDEDTEGEAHTAIFCFAIFPITRVGDESLSKFMDPCYFPGIMGQVMGEECIVGGTTFSPSYHLSAAEIQGYTLGAKLADPITKDNSVEEPSVIASWYHHSSDQKSPELANWAEATLKVVVCLHKPLLEKGLSGKMPLHFAIVAASGTHKILLQGTITIPRSCSESATSKILTQGCRSIDVNAWLTKLGKICPDNNNVTKAVRDKLLHLTHVVPLLKQENPLWDAPSEQLAVPYGNHQEEGLPIVAANVRFLRLEGGFLEKAEGDDTDEAMESGDQDKVTWKQHKDAMAILKEVKDGGASLADGECLRDKLESMSVVDPRWKGALVEVRETIDESLVCRRWDKNNTLTKDVETASFCLALKAMPGVVALVTLGTDKALAVGIIKKKKKAATPKKIAGNTSTATAGKRASGDSPAGSLPEGSQGKPPKKPKTRKHKKKERKTYFYKNNGLGIEDDLEAEVQGMGLDEAAYKASALKELLLEAVAKAGEDVPKAWLEKLKAESSKELTTEVLKAMLNGRVQRTFENLEQAVQLLHSFYGTAEKSSPQLATPPLLYNQKKIGVRTDIPPRAWSGKIAGSQSKRPDQVAHLRERCKKIKTYMDTWRVTDKLLCARDDPIKLLQTMTNRLVKEQLLTNPGGAYFVMSLVCLLIAQTDTDSTFPIEAVGEGFGNMQGALESAFGILCRVYAGLPYNGENKTFMHRIAEKPMPKEIALFLEIGPVMEALVEGFVVRSAGWHVLAASFGKSNKQLSKGLIDKIQSTGITDFETWRKQRSPGRSIALAYLSHVLGIVFVNKEKDKSDSNQAIQHRVDDQPVAEHNKQQLLHHPHYFAQKNVCDPGLKGLWVPILPNITVSRVKLNNEGEAGTPVQFEQVKDINCNMWKGSFEDRDKYQPSYNMALKGDKALWEPQCYKLPGKYQNWTARPEAKLAITGPMRNYWKATPYRVVAMSAEEEETSSISAEEKVEEQQQE